MLVEFVHRLTMYICRRSFDTFKMVGSAEEGKWPKIRTGLQNVGLSVSLFDFFLVANVHKQQLHKEQ